MANYGLRANRPLPVFVNKILLEHNHAHLFMYCPWMLLSAVAELRSCNRLNWPAKSKTFIIILYLLLTYYLYRRSLPTPSDYSNHIPRTLLSRPSLKLPMYTITAGALQLFPYPEYYYSEYTPEEDSKLLEGEMSLLFYYSKSKPTTWSIADTPIIVKCEINLSGICLEF